MTRPAVADAPAPHRRGGVLWVIPGDGDDEIAGSMVFAKRQVASLVARGVAGRIFFLRSRRSVRLLLGELRRFRELIRSDRPALIHAHYGTMTACFCAAATSLPLVITFRGSDLNPYPNAGMRGVLGRLLSQASACRAAAIICVSEELRSRLRWKRQRAVIIPTGVDVAMFAPRPRAQVRAELGWPADGPVVLFNASNEPEIKRLDLAKAAVDAARQSLSDVRFEVLDGTVDPAGVPALMNAADCLLLTSDHEGSPNVVKEAMACNLPVVAVSVGDVAERLRDVQPGGLVASNIAAIATAIVDVLKDGRRSNGRQALVGQQLALTDVASRVIAVYEHVVAPVQIRQ